MSHLEYVAREGLAVLKECYVCLTSNMWPGRGWLSSKSVKCVSPRICGQGGADCPQRVLSVSHLEYVAREGLAVLKEC